MTDFPRTMVGTVSTSRMIIGTNWFLGYTHCTSAKSTSVERIVTNVNATSFTVTGIVGSSDPFSFICVGS